MSETALVLLFLLTNSMNLFAQPSYVVGTQKKGSFEHLKHMLKLIGKKILIILH